MNASLMQNISVQILLYDFIRIWFFLFFVAVVQTLAHNSTATLSVIKDYLINKLQRESKQIEEDERKIQQYREETAHLRSEIQELSTR